MAAQAQERRQYAAPIAFFVDKVRLIGSAGLNLSITSENPTPEGVWFRILHGGSYKSYGEKITITLTPTPAGTDILIHSECGMPTQLFDGGKNKSNVAVIFRYLEAGMPQPAPLPVQQPAPVQPVAPAVKYCTLCGKQNKAESVFCSSCGGRFR